MVASYMVSSVSAIFSALCYAEYAVDFPIAGGGYGFVSLTYGELIGWCVALRIQPQNLGGAPGRGEGGLVNPRPLTCRSAV